MPSRMDGSKPPDWTGFPPRNLDIPEVEILSDSETEPDYFSREIADAIDREYTMYGDLPAPSWIRYARRDQERQIQEEISEEDDREYMHLVRRLRETTRQINAITNSGTFDENITDLINMRTNLRHQVAQMRMNPRINRANARAFQRYVRDQRR